MEGMSLEDIGRWMEQISRTVMAMCMYGLDSDGNNDVVVRA